MSILFYESSWEPWQWKLLYSIQKMFLTCIFNNILNQRPIQVLVMGLIAGSPLVFINWLVHPKNDKELMSSTACQVPGKSMQNMACIAFSMIESL